MLGLSGKRCIACVNPGPAFIGTSLNLTAGRNSQEHQIPKQLEFVAIFEFIVVFPAMMTSSYCRTPDFLVGVLPTARKTGFAVDDFEPRRSESTSQMSTELLLQDNGMVGTIGQQVRNWPSHARKARNLLVEVPHDAPKDIDFRRRCHALRLGARSGQAHQQKLNKRDELNARMDQEWRKWRDRRKRFRTGPAGKLQGADTGTPSLKSLPADGPPGAAFGLEVVDEQGERVLALSEISDPGPRKWESVRGSDNPISSLNPLLSAVPSAATAKDVARNGYYLVQHDGPLVEAKGGGLRAVTKGADGRIQEHARLFEADHLSTLENSAVVWQVASMAVAQAYLHDINLRLGDIQSTVGKVSEFQNDRRMSEITWRRGIFQGGLRSR